MSAIMNFQRNSRRRFKFNLSMTSPYVCTGEPFAANNGKDDGRALANFVDLGMRDMSAPESIKKLIFAEVS